MLSSRKADKITPNKGSHPEAGAERGMWGVGRSGWASCWPAARQAPRWYGSQLSREAPHPDIYLALPGVQVLVTNPSSQSLHPSDTAFCAPVCWICTPGCVSMPLAYWGGITYKSASEHTAPRGLPRWPFTKPEPSRLPSLTTP